MGILAIHVGARAVTAAVVTPLGTVAARSRRDLTGPPGSSGTRSRAGSRAGSQERETAPDPTPDALWQATLAATRSCLDGWAGAPSTLTAVGLATERERFLLWDRETLGAPRQPSAGPDAWTVELCGRLVADGQEARVRSLTGQRLEPGLAGPSLARLAAHEPRTWALVEEGRHAVGPVGSYLVARMTRGTWHLTDVSASARSLLTDLDTGTWSPELCALFGVPLDALPEVVPTWGDLARTDPRSFLGLDLPVTGLAGEASAALLGQGCVDPGDAQCLLGATTRVVANAGAEAVRADGALTFPAWRSPDGRTTYAVETTGPPDGPVAVAPGVRDLVGTLPVRAQLLRVEGESSDDELCRSLAGLLAVPVQRPAEVEPAVLGAGLLAGLGSGTWESLAELRDLGGPGRRFDQAGA